MGIEDLNRLDPLRLIIGHKLLVVIFYIPLQFEASSVKGSDDKEDKRNLAPVPSDGVPVNRVLPEASATLGDDKRVAAVYRLKCTIELDCHLLHGLRKIRNP